MSLSLSPEPSRQSPASPITPVAHLAGLRGTRFWFVPAAMLVLAVLVIAALLATTASTRATISGFSQFVALTLAMSFSGWIAWRSPAGRTRWAWICIGLALLSYVIAEALVIYFSTTTTDKLTTSVADAFFLPFYPLMAVGVLLLPATRGTGAAQVRVFLDVGVAIGALLSVGLVFLIVPRYASGTTVDFVFIAYPIADFTLLLVLVVMILRGVQSTYRPVFFWLAIGMFCFIYADSAFNYLTLPHLAVGQIYSAGLPYVDPFWMVGAFAFALAPLYLLSQGSEHSAAWDWLETLTERATATPFYRSLGQVILLYTPVLVLFGLLFFVKPQARGYNAYPVLVVTALLVVLLIITRQWLTTRDLVDARIATTRAEQLDSLKNQFITNVNHELRTPMMTMQGYIEILGDLQDQIDAQKQADMLGRARRANVALVQLLQSLLDTRRIDQEASDFVPAAVNVHAVTQAALMLVDPREGQLAQHRVSVQVPTDLVIWGDATRLQQILTNLISNAIKYSTPGTAITVEAHAVAARRRQLLRWGKDHQGHGPMVEIVVHDEGHGIPPEQIPLLFHRFVRLPRDLASRVRGTGLGLYLCRLFTEAMGGTIWVESSGVAGEGSTFHLRLPVPTMSGVSAVTELLQSHPDEDTLPRVAVHVPAVAKEGTQHA